MGTDKIATLFRYKRWIDIETLQAIKELMRLRMQKTPSDAQINESHTCG